MAGDWIKIEHATPDKPEIFELARLAEMEPDKVLGVLIRVWIWADQNTDTGRLGPGADAAINRVAGVPNFSENMAKAGWLRRLKRGFSLPHFHRHNGNSAKTRALTKDRAVTHRNRKRNAPIVTASLPEKRREEKSKKTKNNPSTPHGGFDVFWASWPRHPRKAGKAKCQAIWKREKLNTHAEQILEALEAYKVSDQWTKDGGQFIPAPQTWLNQAKWDCDIADITRKTGGHTSTDTANEDYGAIVESF